MPVKLPFGLRRSDNRWVDVHMVPNGSKSDCICPICRDDLIARNGGTSGRIHHFSHKADCAASYETVVHETAKQIIKDLGFIWLPIGDGKKFAFAGSTLENRYDRVQPDVTVWSPGGRKLAVEIYVTHPVGDEKLDRLRELQMSCVEYNLSNLPRDISYEALTRMFADGDLDSLWVYNHRDVELTRQLDRRARTEAIVRPTIIRKNNSGYDIFHVEPCPVAARNPRGKPIGNVNLDCRGCRFCFGVIGHRARPTGVKCGGHVAQLFVAYGTEQLAQIARTRGTIRFGH